MIFRHMYDPKKKKKKRNCKFQLFLTEGMGYLQWQIVIKYI